jgi:hypothetical protein
MTGKQTRRERNAALNRVQRFARTHGELVGHLREQLRFLRRSADAYDAGDEAEAKRLAAVLRSLLLDRGKEHALLTQLQVLPLLEFMDTALRDGLQAGTSSALVIAESSGPLPTGHYVPPLGDLSPPRKNSPKAFNLWWHQDVAQTNSGERFSREDLVLAAAQSEGGVHVDPHRHRIYQSLVVENGLGWFLFGNQESIALSGDALLGNVRQIAFEAERTLVEQLPVILPEAIAEF